MGTPRSGETAQLQAGEGSRTRRCEMGEGSSRKVCQFQHHPPPTTAPPPFGDQTNATSPFVTNRFLQLIPQLIRSHHPTLGKPGLALPSPTRGLASRPLPLDWNQTQTPINIPQTFTGPPPSFILELGTSGPSHLEETRCASPL